MAKQSEIAWTRSTFNPWIGCTRVGPGCDGCYAEALDRRMRFGGAVHWGPGVPRHRTSATNWRAPLAWNSKAPDSEFSGRRGFWPVFCASLGDVFDNEVPARWRSDLFALIRSTPALTWLLLTKRVGNVASMMAGTELPNAWIGATIVNQEEWDRDAPKLLQLRGFGRRFVSYEPALGPVDWGLIGTAPKDWGFGYVAIGDLLHWIIVGGESVQAGHAPRLFDFRWARSTIEQCREGGVAVFMKQCGSNCSDNDSGALGHSVPWDDELHGTYYRLKDRAGADPEEWPEDIRVREFP